MTRRPASNDTKYHGNDDHRRTVEELGSYSVGGDGKFIAGESQQAGSSKEGRTEKFTTNTSELKDLKWPKDLKKTYFDLKVGQVDTIKRNGVDNMDNFLRWISLNAQNLKDERNGRLLDVDFVCSRGVLQRVMCSPSERNYGWIVSAVKFKGNIYLFRFQTKKEEWYAENMEKMEKEQTSWGLKFEQYMTSGNQDEPLNQCGGFYSVLRTSFGGLSVLVRAEIDAIDRAKSGVDCALNSYVELKTSTIVEEEGQKEEVKKIRKKNLQLKMKQWWAQTHIVGVPTVVCGFRDSGGVVREIKTYKTEELPNIAARGPLQKPWDPDTCMRFLINFLNQVRTVLDKDKPRVYYKFEWEPKHESMSQPVNAKVDSDKYRFIPVSYFSDPHAFFNRQEGK